MRIKLLLTIAAMGLLAAHNLIAATPNSGYDNATARDVRPGAAIATDEEPPTIDDANLPQLKKPIAMPKKPAALKPDSDLDAANTVAKPTIDRTAAPPLGSTPKLTPPTAHNRPAYAASNVSDWPKPGTSTATAKMSAKSSSEMESSAVRPGVAPSTTLSKATATKPGQIERPSQQFAQQASAVSDYRTHAQQASAFEPSPSSVRSSTPSPTPESVGTGMALGSNSMGPWDDNGAGDSCGCGQCDSCCYNGFNLCGECGWFAGADYLLLRPSFSEDQAYIKRVTTTTPEEVVTVTDTVVHQDFGYNSSLRAFFGYRCSCNEEIRFTYWNYGASSSQSTGVATDDGSILYAGQLELNTTPGQHINIEGGLRANVYDIEYSKCCCNPCNTCNPCCPPWTLKYSAGVRIADIGRHDDDFLIDVDGTTARAALISSSFIGAGPRVGLEGRRFFSGTRASIFAKTNLSLLLGEFDINETRHTPGTTPELIEHYFDSHNRIIPVAEIELGGSWQMADRINMSAGYLFQAWWDLGAFEQIQGNVFLNPIDDANIMAFDGLFARVEITF